MLREEHEDPGQRTTDGRAARGWCEAQLVAGDRTNLADEGDQRFADQGLRDGARAGRARAWRERDVAALAVAQHAVLTHRQLVELGIGRGAIEHALASGRLHRLHRGVYAIAPLPALPPLALEQAALLACGRGTVVSHRSAAAIWRMQVQPSIEVEVTAVGHQRGRKAAGIRMHRTIRLDRSDVRRRGGLPVTTPARTLVDLAGLLPERELERSFDEAVAKRIVTRGAIATALTRHPGRAGHALLRELCEAKTISRSTGEKELLKLTRRAQLPPPETNVRFGGYEVDFLWRRERVAVELDSYSFHSSRAALERDHAKDLALQAAGFTIIRISGRELVREPEVVLARIATALGRGAAQSSAG